MIYHLSLQSAGIAAGLTLLFVSLPGLVKPEAASGWMRTLPRSRAIGIVLLTLAFLWSFWLLGTMEMGEFSSFRKPLLFALPVGYFLVLRFVNEFLAVRALGILFLLAAEPLLEAAFLRYEMSRLLVTVFAYVLIIAGLFWVTMPYLLRDHIRWGTRSTARWRAINALALVYSAALLICAITRY
ncbi:MAG: hypothetical protein M3505_00845 [Verrucomicrobiota bacterium]|jgi:hypothetical protein|nr:hypothetical protein [Chthoniobacterales bacterium]MDQ3313177.1 hypothetical protein [Verrucomicrobiota bacterium]